MDLQFPAAVYLLCFATSLVCAVMLGRSYFSAKAPLLFWSAICFGFLALANLLLVLDLLVIRSVSLQPARVVANFAAISTLLFGFIWNGED